MLIPVKDYEEGKMTLPIGIVKNGELLRKVVLHEFNDLTLELLHDPKVKAKGQFEFMLRALALTIDTIEDIPVHKEYRLSGWKKIPDILKDLPLFDASGVLVAAHIFNYGDVLENVQTECPKCKKLFAADYDLSGIELIGTDPYYLTTEDGVLTKCSTETFGINIKLKKGIPGLSGELYTKIVMEVPVLRSGLKHIDFFADDVVFSRRIYYSSIQELRTATDELCPDKEFNSLGSAFLNKLKPMDRKIITDTFGGMLQIDSFLQLPCGNPRCGASISRRLDPSFFFPV